MNPLKKLINEIGLEIGELFRLDCLSSSATFYFAEGADGKISLLSYYDGSPTPTMANSNYLYIVLNQPERIKKIHWKPKYGDIYHEIIDDGEDSFVCKAIFTGDSINYGSYVLGNCFRTKEEAERIKDKYCKRLKEMYEKGDQINIFNINIQNNGSKKLPERKDPVITKRI